MGMEFGRKNRRNARQLQLQTGDWLKQAQSGENMLRPWPAVASLLERRLNIQCSKFPLPRWPINVRDFKTHARG